MLALAEAADTAHIPEGMSLPKELKLREDRLAAMATAKAQIAARAAQRYAREKAEYDEKMVKREAREKACPELVEGRRAKSPAANHPQPPSLASKTASRSI